MAHCFALVSQVRLSLLGLQQLNFKLADLFLEQTDPVVEECLSARLVLRTLRQLLRVTALDVSLQLFDQLKVLGALHFCPLVQSSDLFGLPLRLLVLLPV